MGPRAPVPLIVFLVLCSVQAIRVPVAWNSESAVPNEKPTQDVEIIGESNVPASNSPVPIPVEYFQYPANKPQFAVDVAKFHGVQNPQNHYTSYPIRPYTGKEKPVLGKHKILDENNPTFHEFQQFTKVNEGGESSITPTSSEYEVFHPYKAEEPALQELYKDPVLDKIRNDIYNSQTTLQKYEKEAGEPDIQDGEYLESPVQTDRKKFPQKNIPVPYEVHRPQRRPIYYRPSPYSSRDHYLNHRFRHPWNQHNAKIRPLHYRPLKNHLQRLRQNHAFKYDDERNEYPQVPTLEQISEVPEGYDIYERGKAKYVALRNNVDESINNAVKQNRPTIYQRLELEDNGKKSTTQVGDDDDNEFIPIKNYAQVRKTETTRHLPKIRAFEDAASLDELKNAPRLREAIKSTKAQTVYTEEGYEDAAYDHEGEEKHAAENEAHGGYLSEKEISGGKYKAPSVSQNYEDAGGNEYRDQILHGEKWKDNDKDKEEESEAEDYSEDDTAHSIEADVYDDVTGGRDKRQNEADKIKQISSENEEALDEEAVQDVEAPVERSKRENKLENSSLVEENNANDTTAEHDVNKRDTDFKVPQINLNSTYLTAAELAEKAKIRDLPKKVHIQDKYPYYFKNLKNINRDSPLRYAENLKFIPKKSKSGTEFYDSRSKILECPEVDDEVDALPEKLKRDGHPDESDEAEKDGEPTTGKADFSQLKNSRRLKGLGDKIDCFKAKFFGENPLDSPFFKEEIISNPEPVTAPNLPIYKLTPKEPLTLASTLSNVFNISNKLQEANPDTFSLFDKLKNEQRYLKESLAKTSQELIISLLPQNSSSIANNPQSSQNFNVYSDVLKNINHLRQPLTINNNFTKQIVSPVNEELSGKNITYNSYLNKEDMTKDLPSTRKKRATPFIYEPYKIIRDGQTQESKKTTTTSNISPLIKQLQSSRVIDRVTKNSEEKDQPVKRNVAARSYKDIGRKDRIKVEDKGAKGSEPSFVDVSVDQRRGEPRYEVRLTNHKTQYAPVEHKKSMSLENYQSQTNKTIRRPQIRSDQSSATAITSSQAQPTQKSRQRRPTTKPFFDVSQYLPKSTKSDTQKPSASNTIRKVIKSPNPIKQVKNEPETKDIIDDEDYEEYDDEELTTTTTTTPKPSFKKRRRTTTTTTTTKPDEEEEPVLPKLRLITRFNTTPVPSTTTTLPEATTEKGVNPVSPKYTEKKKKSSKSTLVTDTKSYGDGDENMMKDEVDAMIGVQQDMEEYKPHYEKEMERNIRRHPASTVSSEENVSDDEDSDEDDDEEFDDDDDNISDSEEDDESSSSSETEAEVTTPEPTKQTLVRTTEAPVSTTETRSAKLELKPIVHKKKIEIHKELPVNKSAPHITQFKQDYKEVEIIKEMPIKLNPPHRVSHRKPQKNLEALELYKDDNLAEEINKLGAVEVFKENLDLVKGPKHGGNYKSIELEETSLTVKPPRRGKPINDADTSQTKNEKLVDVTEVLPARRANGRNRNSRLRNSGRSAKLELEETSDTNPKRLHGGNLKSKQDIDRVRVGSKNAKLIELDDDDHNDESADDTNGRNFKTYDSSRSNGRPLHGGNYRSAKIVASNTEDETASIKEKAAANNHRSKSATLLSSFAQAVPHLTTTPAYILDPSKRMYYYVDAKR